MLKFDKNLKIKILKSQILSSKEFLTTQKKATKFKRKIFRLGEFFTIDKWSFFVSNILKALDKK